MINRCLIRLYRLWIQKLFEIKIPQNGTLVTLNSNAEQTTLHLLTVVAGLVLAVQHYMQMFGKVKNQDKHENDMAPKKNGVEEGSKKRKYTSFYPHVRFVSAGLFHSQPVATSSFALVRFVTLLGLLFGTFGAKGASCNFVNKKDAVSCHLQEAVNSCLEENDGNGLGNGTCPIFAASNDTTTGRPYGVMSEWDVSRVTDLSALFHGMGGMSSFNADISKWNTSKVTKLMYVFAKNKAFNADLSKWDTAQVTSFSHAFQETLAFNGDLSKWDTSKAVDMSKMFWYSAFQRGVSKWDTALVQDMESTFDKARAFNGDVSKWNTALVQDMSSTFSYAKAFNGDVSKWNTARVSDMSGSACSFLILL